MQQGRSRHAVKDTASNCCSGITAQATSVTRVYAFCVMRRMFASHPVMAKCREQQARDTSNADSSASHSRLVASPKQTLVRKGQEAQRQRCGWSCHKTCSTTLMRWPWEELRKQGMLMITVVAETTFISSPRTLKTAPSPRAEPSGTLDSGREQARKGLPGKTKRSQLHRRGTGLDLFCRLEIKCCPCLLCVGSTRVTSSYTVTCIFR